MFWRKNKKEFAELQKPNYFLDTVDVILELATIGDYIPIYNYTYTFTEGITNINTPGYDFDAWQGKMLFSTFTTCTFSGKPQRWDMGWIHISQQLEVET